MRGLLIHFPQDELRVALQVLKALYTVTHLTFIREAIEDVEVALRPRLTLVSHYHFCEKCFTEINDAVGDNFVHYVDDKTDKWKHKICPSLKPVRPN